MNLQTLKTKIRKGEIDTVITVCPDVFGRLVGKRMKAWNKRVYYAVKYLLLGGILAAFLATAFA